MSISHQLHSRNDLREWNAMFLKGSLSVKIDPHFLRNSDKFILSHDTPLPWQYRHNQYSTLDDVLLYLQSAPSCIHGKSIDIALCFKAAPKMLCDPQHQQSKEVQQWMSMAESFFARADQVVRQVKETMDISVTFVLDGDGKPCNCLADKFRPWKSTWIETDKCSQDCYNSNEGFCERFAILNDPASSDWIGMASSDNHYGKFGATNHTLQVWEPDSQLEISNLVQGYLQGQARGVPSGGGLAFAINVDVAMFDTFTSRALVGTTNANGFNILIEDGEASDATTPSLVYQSPGEVTLQYWVSSKQVTRQLTFQPFEQIEVGPPSIDYQGVESLDSLVNIDLKLSEADYRMVTERFGNAKELSWCVEQVDSFSFLFVAAVGKVFASVRRSKAEYTDFRLIGLGTRVHASSLNGTLLVVSEGNHCYNSHIHNTRSAPLACRPKTLKRDACPYSLDYSVGTAENWFLWLQRELTVITSCNEHILHGTFSAGRNPSGALFPLDDKAENNGKIGIMVAHDPYSLHEESKCGTPITGESGIMISSFASYVVQDRFSETFRYAERIALESNGSREFIQLKVGFAIGMVVCWFVMRQRRKRGAYQAVE